MTAVLNPTLEPALDGLLQQGIKLFLFQTPPEAAQRASVEKKAVLEDFLSAEVLVIGIL